MNRKGRKRKSGKRTASGALVRVHVDYRVMAADWPGRRDLPKAYRLDERAGTTLGRLNIKWRTSGLPVLIKPGIPDEEYEAGRQYGAIVNRYLAMVGAPRVACPMATFVSGADAESAPVGGLRIVPDDYDETRTERYMRAYEAIRSRPSHMAVNRVAVHDEPCPDSHFAALRAGLQDLARHFGLIGGKR